MGINRKQGNGYYTAISVSESMRAALYDIHGIENLGKKSNMSNTIRKLLWMGINEYKKDKDYERRLRLAQYKQEHDGLLPYQYDAIHADKALQVFDSIE